MLTLPRILTISLFFSPALIQAAEAWAPGVSRESGWVDFNKNCKDSNNYMADMGMCWAASASNIITWWQDNTLSEKDKENLPSANAWDVFRTVYKDVGGNPNTAYNWWINGLSTDAYGVPSYPDSMDLSQENENKENSFWFEGGFLKDYYDTSLSENKITLTYENKDSYEYSELIVNAIQSGYALSVSVRNSQLAHSYTVWGVGYEITENGYELTKAWITDSDDGTTQLLEKGLLCANKEGAPAVAFDEQFGASWTVVAGMRVSPIPEPSAFGLLAGILALSLAATSRRRKIHSR